MRYDHAINSTTLVNRLREEKSVLIVPGDHFGMDGYLRLGFGSHPNTPARPRTASRSAHVAAGTRISRVATLARLARMNQPELTLVLIGFGNVARRFVKLLDETADRLDFSWKIVGISTRHHGSVVDPDGVDTRRAHRHVEGRQTLDRLDPAPRERSGIDVIRQVADAMADDAAEGRLICIETTVLDIDRGEPAVAHVRAALEGQAHVVTANKGPAAFAYHELDASPNPSIGSSSSRAR